MIPSMYYFVRVITRVCVRLFVWWLECVMHGACSCQCACVCLRSVLEAQDFFMFCELFRNLLRVIVYVYHVLGHTRDQRRTAPSTKCQPKPCLYYCQPLLLRVYESLAINVHTITGFVHSTFSRWIVDFIVIVIAYTREKEKISKEKTRYFDKNFGLIFNWLFEERNITFKKCIVFLNFFIFQCIRHWIFRNSQESRIVENSYLFVSSDVIASPPESITMTK